MPFVLFLIGAATLMLVATTSHAKTAPLAPSQQPPRFMLDPQLDARLRAQVEAALASETDPTRLEAFAASVAGAYPYAAWYLRQKAEGMRRMGYGASPGAALPAARGDGLDANLPDQLRFNIIELLTQGTDPTMLESFAGQLGGYPLAASALRLRAAYLRSIARSVPTSGFQAASSAGTPGAAAQQASISPPLPGFDPSLPPEISAQVTNALLTENDPSKLRALGNSLMAQYPTTATMLLAKANAISLIPLHPTGGGVPSPSGTPSTETAPASPPIRLPEGWVLPASPSPQPPTATPTAAAPALFDVGMSQDEQTQVMTALSSENDPAKLRRLADAIGPRYPRAALLLTNKAAAIQTMLIPAALPPAAAVPAASPLPVAVSAPMPTGQTGGGSSRKYHVKQGDFPIKIAKFYGQPEAAWRDLVDANSHKAKASDGNFKQLLPGEDLNVPPSWPIRAGEVQGAPSATTVTTRALVANPNVPSGPLGIPLPGAPVLDLGIPADVAQAVMTAAATETDPVKLRNFASSIMATYPIAAAVLLAKASGASLALPGLATPPPAASQAPAPPAPAPVATTPLPGTIPPSASTPPLLQSAADLAHSLGLPTSLPPLSSIPVAASTASASGGVYKVERGDSPSKIAKKLTGNDRRWPELVKANPSKATTADGNFKSLQPGEVLQLPAAWTTSAPTNALARA